MIRPELPPMPPRIAALPMSERGYPVPFFVAYVDGKPEFRMADYPKKVRCIKEKLCWVCGQPVGKYRCFPIGPMCVVNRNTAEPPCHHDCAEWSVQACPFMLNPNMVRRENNLPESRVEPGGIMIRRNPGVMALYTCITYKIEVARDGILFALGDPVGVTWWKEGRAATREEVMDSITSGIPLLREVCDSPEDHYHLGVLTGNAMKLVPAEAEAQKI